MCQIISVTGLFRLNHFSSQNNITQIKLNPRRTIRIVVLILLKRQLGWNWSLVVFIFSQPFYALIIPLILQMSREDWGLELFLLYEYGIMSTKNLKSSEEAIRL